jgi:hypothetical protein
MSWANPCRCSRELKVGAIDLNRPWGAPVNRLYLLRAFFEGGGFAAQMREHFAGEMK